MLKIAASLLVLAVVCYGQKSSGTYLTSTYIQRPLTYVNKPLDILPATSSYVNVQGPTVQYVSPQRLPTIQYINAQPAIQYPAGTKSINYVQPQPVVQYVQSAWK